MNPPAPVLRRSELALAVLAAPALALLFFHFALNEMPFFRDLFHEFYPMKVFLAEQLRQGRLPRWNPALFMGMPFLAELATAGFYPGNVLFLFLSPVEGLRYYLLLHYPFAGLGLYLLLRDLGLRPAAAALSAMTFAFSGYLVGQHGNLIYLISPSYFPWALLAYRRLALRPGFRGAAAAAFACVLPFLAGEPQGAALAALLGLGFILFVPPAGKKSLSPRTLIWSAASLLLAAGLAMIQLLPSWELSQLSERAQGFPFERAAYWSLHPLRILELFWPNLWGLPWPQDRFWAEFLLERPLALPWSMSLYLGLWAWLAGAYALRQSERTVRFFAAVAGLAFLLVLGRYTPVFHWAYLLVPGFRWFRYPEKYLSVFSLALAALAGFGTQKYLDQIPHVRRFSRVGLAGCGLLVILGVTAYLGEPALESLFAHQAPPGSIRSVASALEATLAASTRTALAAAVLAGILVLAWKSPRFHRKLPFLLAAFVGLDLYSANRPLVDTAPASFYTRPSLAAEKIVQEQGGSREKFRFFRDQSLKDLVGRFHQHQASRLWDKDTLEANWSQALGLEEFEGYSQAVPERYYHVWEKGMSLSVLQAFNVKYVVAGMDRSALDTYAEIRVLAEWPEEKFRLLRVEGYFPRAYLVSSAVAVAEAGEALAWLNRADLRQEVVLLTSEAIPRRGGKGLFQPARILDDQPDRVELEVQSPEPGWLVLNDSYYPGWNAEVNGKPVPIYRANYLVRAVRVEAGTSRVTFVYRPQSYRWGRAITLATLGLVFVGLWIGGKSRKEKVTT